jgi:hypothetical protein
MGRGLTWCALCLSVIVLSGCARLNTSLHPEEVERVAWWIEDVIHGVPRRAGELDLEDPSPAMRRLQPWLIGAASDAPGRCLVEITRRQERVVRLQAMLKNGWILMDDRGLVGPSPDLTGSEATVARIEADGETTDRSGIDAFILTTVMAGERTEEAWKQATMAARQTYDRAAGGRQGVRKVDDRSSAKPLPAE